MFKDHSNLILSDNERAKLKAEFDQLETIDQKYDFWKERFGFDYSQHYSLEQQSIEDFKIVPKNPLETEEINKRLYNDSVMFFGNGKDDSPENWKVPFIESITKSINKEACVELELNKIDDYFFSLKHPQQIKKSFGIGYYFTKSASEWFFMGYEQYLINRKEFDWSEKLYHPKAIVDILFGIEWAKYREFVKNYLTPKISEQKKTYNLSHDQQLFILDYLGLFKNLDNVKRAKLFGPIINRDVETTRQRLSSIEKRKTIKNLESILSYFTELGFEEQIQLIKKDIDTIKRRRK